MTKYKITNLNRNNDALLTMSKKCPLSENDYLYCLNQFTRNENIFLNNFENVMYHLDVH
jgi:hypothetical protein